MREWEAVIGQQFKNTAVGKTIALSQIATDTATALSSAGVAAAKATALTGNPLSGIAVYTTTAAQVIANAIRAKSILSGGGAGSSGGGSGSSGNNQAQGQPQRLSTFIPQQDQQGGITRVVVLEKDITSTQDRVARIRDNATIE